MFIKKITVENFRSIKERVTVWSNDSKLKIFIGPNNIGKSNILRAINLFFNLETEPNSPFIPSKDLCLKGGRMMAVTLEFHFNKIDDKGITKYIDKYHKDEFENYIVPVALRFFSTGKFQYIFTNKKGQKKAIKDLQERILDVVNCIYIPAIKDYKHIINRDMMRKIVATTFQGWGRGRTSKKLGESKEKFQNIMNGLQKILNSTGDFMTDLVGATAKGIKRFDFSLPYDNLEDFLGKINFDITEVGLPQKISLDNEGSGIQSFTIYAMMKLLHEFRPRNTFRKSQFVWLIEEPETFMHHDLQRKTLARLKEYSTQGHIFVTTHSPVFVDKENYCNCYHVTKDNSTKIDIITTKTIRDIVSGSLGVNFQDMFLFNKYNILVEGETDKDLIIGLNQIFIKKGEKNLLNLDETDFIICGSANAVPHFYLMYNSFNQYANFIALLDRDESGNKAYQELIDKGIDKKYLLQIPLSDFKTEAEIEDIVNKKIWDLCLAKIDEKKLINIKSSQGNYIGYEFLPKNRIEVKKMFTKLLLDHAKNNITDFCKYKDLINQISSLVQGLEPAAKSR